MDWWEEQPQIPYTAWLNSYRRNMPTNWTQYWQSQFGNMYNRYQSELMEQTLQGVSPGEMPEWMDWLNTLDPRREWNMLPRYQRGLRPSTFAPRMSRIGW